MGPPFSFVDYFRRFKNLLNVYVLYCSMYEGETESMTGWRFF